MRINGLEMCLNTTFSISIISEKSLEMRNRCSSTLEVSKLSLGTWDFYIYANSSAPLTPYVERGDMRW